MRKTLIPLFASLTLCGAGVTALVMSSANAQPSPHKPMMVAMAEPAGLQLAANDVPPGPPPDARRDLRRAPGDIAARMKLLCQDQVARQSGRLAYLETKLTLTGSQQPLFQRWKDAKLGVARRQAEQCAQRPVPQRQAAQQTPAQNRADARPGPADRMAREEERLKARLADIQTERPALAAFYNALSPDQKMLLARSGREDRGFGRHGMMRHSRFADARGPGPMGRPPLER